jgi:prophage maintenance system killer protein
MEWIFFPFERVIEINTQILTTEPGMKGPVNLPLLQGALARIDNAIAYNGLDDVFEIAASTLPVSRKATHCLMLTSAPGLQSAWSTFLSMIMKSL